MVRIRHGESNRAGDCSVIVDDNRNGVIRINSTVVFDNGNARADNFRARFASVDKVLSCVERFNRAAVDFQGAAANLNAAVTLNRAAFDDRFAADRRQEQTDTAIIAAARTCSHCALFNCAAVNLDVVAAEVFSVVAGAVGADIDYPVFRLAAVAADVHFRVGEGSAV